MRFFFVIYIWPIVWHQIQFLSRMKHLKNVGIELPLLALLALGWKSFNTECLCAQFLENLKRPNKLRHEFRYFPPFSDGQRNKNQLTRLKNFS